MHFQTNGGGKGKKGEKGPFTLNPAISIKNQLQEYAQHMGVAFPFYKTRNGPDGSSWVTSVNFNDVEYSDNIPAASKKMAEARAAEECLRALGLIASPDKPVPPTPIIVRKPETIPESVPTEPKPKSTGKADLHLFLTKRKMQPAVYVTKEADGDINKGFVSSVEVNGETWECAEVSPNKKAAENKAAEIALKNLELMPEKEVKSSLPAPENLVLTLIVADPKFKSNLNEYLFRRELPSPVYTCELTSTPTFKGYKATCEVVGKVFHSEEGKLYASKKHAEQAAACTAWNSLKAEVAAQDAAEKKIQAIPYRVILQEHLGRRDLDQPVFTHEKVEGNGFIAECSFEGQSYKSTTPYHSKKTAESEAAKAALEGLGIVNLNKVIERKTLKAKRLIGTGFNWRDALIKFFETKGRKMPEIVVEARGDRYCAHISIGGRKYLSDAIGFQDQDTALQSASRNACIALSIPLHVPLPGTKANGQGQADGPSKPTLDVIMDDAMGQDVHVPNSSLKRRLEEWIENRPLPAGVKRFRTEDAWAVPKHLLKSLVVVEIWPEKKNVVIVGNDSFSCPMLCLNGESKREIEVDGKSVELVPGMVLEDVEAVFKYVPYCGGIALLANQCARVSLANSSTSPVVTGAGVIVLTREDDVAKVLLKRYKTSTAFIPAAQELSFALRRAVTVWEDFTFYKGKKKFHRNKENINNPVDVQKVVEKIHLWTNEEVDAVRNMTTESMNALFSVTKWKWMDRWALVFEGKTKTELIELLKKQREERVASGKPENDDEGQAIPPLMGPEDEEIKEEVKEEQEQEEGSTANKAEDTGPAKEEVEDNVPLKVKFGFDEVAKLAEAEFQRRQNLKEDGSLDDLVLRPWGFPKGGFRHQSLSTGIHLETAAECARRELKEECGIPLKLSDVLAAEKVLVLRTDADNLNPHKGDANVYFFKEVDPSVSKTVGKPIQEIMDITKNPIFYQRHKHHPFQKKKPMPQYWQQYHLRQMEVHEEFTWFPLEEAAALSPIFKYVMTTDDFRSFAKLPPKRKVEEPVPPSPARGAGGRRGRR